MARVAILGGGISGLAAAYELERQRRDGRPAVDWHLFEATARLGGTVSTTRMTTVDGDYILEDGPDGWVTEKPWARLLAEELGLGGELLPFNEATKRTYVVLEGRLVQIPARMRLMVPEDLGTLESPGSAALFSAEARRAYAEELTRSAELRAGAPGHDESVASFVRRHFGQEVLRKVAAPLLSGIFGGDVERLSVRAVMPQFVLMEAESGSLIAGLQKRRRVRGDGAAEATFTSLRRGMGSLVEGLVAALPRERLHTGVAASGMVRLRSEWGVGFSGAGAHGCAVGLAPFDRVLLATPVDVTRRLLAGLDEEAAALLPVEASSAVLATLCWPAEQAKRVVVPPGFGFLVPPAAEKGDGAPALLAATFVDQKYAERAPAGARVLRAFFGGKSAEAMAERTDAEAAATGMAALRAVMGPLPEPEGSLTTVRRWPRSLPQYEVGHMERVQTIEARVRALDGLHLLGNALHGVGVPDLIRDARMAARTLCESLN